MSLILTRHQKHFLRLKILFQSDLVLILLKHLSQVSPPPMYRAVSVLSYSNPLGHSSQLSGVAEVKVCVLTESFCIFFNFLSIMPPHVKLAENPSIQRTNQPAETCKALNTIRAQSTSIYSKSKSFFKPPSMPHNRSNQPKVLTQVAHCRPSMRGKSTLVSPSGSTSTTMPYLRGKGCDDDSSFASWIGISET